MLTAFAAKIMAACKESALGTCLMAELERMREAAANGDSNAAELTRQLQDA